MPPTQQRISPERLAKVDAARQTWIRQLVDMSRRNNLLYHRDLKVGTLDLSEADADVMQALLQSGRSGSDGVRLTDLVDVTRKTQATAALAEISNRARSNFEERGLDTLFLAMGLATWTAADGGRNTSAPVLLVPLQAVQSGARNGPWSVRRSGDVKLNDVLIHALREEHGIMLNPEILLPELLGDDEGEAFDLQPLFGAIRERAAKVTGFDITPRWVVGNFAFQKMAIVKDLNELLGALSAHDIVAAIARDQGAEQSARGDRISVDPRQVDLQPPDEEFLIRDADSSQQQAIAATLRGQNGVISGPPGTGKSQTISNLIAELVARGKTILFVAEKRAALDVVLNRLKDADLAHLCLDCHGAELSRRHIAEQFQESLIRVREAPIPDAAVVHKKFVERRDRLNAHVRALHTPRQPWGITLYKLYGRLLGLPKGAVCQCRLPKRVLATFDEATLDAACEQMREMATLSGLFTGDSTSSWTGASLTTTEEVRRSVERARRLANERWQRWEATLVALLGGCPAKSPQTIADAQRLLDVLSSIEQTLETVREDFFREELPRLASALAPAQSLLGAAFAMLFNGDFRATLRRVREHCVGGKLSAMQALPLVTRVQSQLKTWREAAADRSSYPVKQPRFAKASAAWTVLLEDLKPLVAVFGGRSLNELKLAEAGSWLSSLASDATSPSQILKLHGIVTAFKTQGLEPVIKEIAARRPDPAVWPDVLRHTWLSSCLEEIQLQDPDVPGFSGRRHDQIANEFRELDKKRLEVAVQRVQRAHAMKALEVRNKHPEQNMLVTREAAKRTRHLPLRRLFSEAPEVLLALRPCWMASPLSVSQLIPGDTPLFDVVIFDEASQVLPEDAITSLLRGRQAVIAGDQRQLPPTTFFATGDPGEEGDEDSATAGFQSILDVMSSFLEPAWSLDWHYRSRDEALIAYSNHRIYNGRLVTFPGPGSAGAVRHELVPHVPGTGAQEASVSAEVQRVVDLVIEQARTRPDESLGVITMGIEHARRIEMALERARQLDPGLEPLFAPDQRERFFVKNLERVQGDERDAIILSIGYGKNDAGQLVYRFGPLLQEGGERRLNVAITSARRRMTIVSSFSHQDVQADYPKVGVRLLRGFLEYAASGGQRFERGTVTDVPLNDFEQSVFDELTRRGLKLVGQVGSSRYRIDMVAMHPEQDGRFVMAIECDGASYHSAPTARDRDRLRQQQLEALGWRFHRIWSTDWFLRREEEVQRALQAFQEAVRGSERQQALAFEAGGSAVQPAAGPVAAPRVRGTRPGVRSGMSIGDYSFGELRDMIRWVLSDGRLHTDEEVVAEVTRELGFERRGPKIVAAIKAAIRSVRP
jgi:very-short-patch-repair endonuclease/DNA polymerase III delta prime subunit